MVKVVAPVPPFATPTVPSESVRGVEPITIGVPVRESGEDAESVVVATEPSVAGVPLVDVQYES